MLQINFVTSLIILQIEFKIKKLIYNFPIIPSLVVRILPGGLFLCTIRIKMFKVCRSTACLAPGKILGQAINRLKNLLAFVAVCSGLFCIGHALCGGRGYLLAGG